MSYFDDVYLKRVNRFGNTLQERIQNKKEYDFIEAVLKKSPNQVSIWEGIDSWNDAEEPPDYLGILQTKSYDQDEVVDYLLVPCDRKIELGNLLWFQDIRHEKRVSPFLAYAIDPYTSQGYNRYTVIELEEVLEWYLDGVKYSSYAHAAGGGSGARDKNINLKFRTQFSESGVYLPNKRYSIVMPANNAIHKNHKVTLGDETWRVTGFDKISVKGVMYITLEESLMDKNDDIPIAGSNEEENWFITTPLGDGFEIYNEEPTPVVFDAFYKDKKREGDTAVEIKPIAIETVIDEGYIPYEIQSLRKDKKFFSGEEFLIIPTLARGWPITTARIKVGIKDQEKTEKIFNFKFKSIYSSQVAIVGPDTINMGDIVTYTIESADAAAVSAITIAEEEQKYAEIISRTENTVTIKAKEIGYITLSVTYLNKTATLPIEIQSIWLGGKDNVNT